MEELQRHLRELVHDQSHFTARWLAEGARVSGVEVERLAIGGTALFLVVVGTSEHGALLANSVLIATPLLLTYQFPRERPPERLLLLYWTVFALFTALERVLQTGVPGYFVLKLMLLAALFLRPVCGAQRLREALERAGVSSESEEPDTTAFNPEDLRALEKERNKKSPPPEKPEGERVTRRRHTVVKSTADALATSRLTFGGNRTPNTSRSRTEAREASVRTAKARDDNSVRRSASKREAHASASARTAVAPSVKERTNDAATNRERLPEPAPPLNPNPMLTHSHFALSPAQSHDSSSTDSMNAPTNLNDLLFFPMQKIVFNAPFNDRNLSYHMTIQNNCVRWIGFAIKSNAIPRVTANPPCGILRPKQRITISVNLEKFEWADVDTSRDRLAFDYVFVEPETPFSMKIFQGIQTRRRKNIKVEYNP